MRDRGGGFTLRCVNAETLTELLRLDRERGAARIRRAELGADVLALADRFGRDGEGDVGKELASALEECIKAYDVVQRYLVGVERRTRDLRATRCRAGGRQRRERAVAQGARDLAVIDEVVVAAAGGQGAPRGRDRSSRWPNGHGTAASPSEGPVRVRGGGAWRRRGPRVRGMTQDADRSASLCSNKLGMITS